MSECNACRTHARFNFWCLECCMRLLTRFPSREQRAGYLASIERACGPEHADKVRAEFLKRWESKKK